MPLLEPVTTPERAASALPLTLRAALLDPAVWQDGLYKFSLATNLAVALVDAEGRSLTSRNPQPLWSLFRRYRPAGPGDCPFALAPIRPCTCVAQARQTGRRAWAGDRTGLVHVAVPLVLGEHRLGALLAGQVFTQYPEQLAVERVAEQFGLSPGRAWQQARLEQPVKRATLEVYADLLATLGQTFLQTQYHTLTETDRLAAMTRLRDQALAEMAERERAERALRTSEESYRTLFESIDEGFCVIEVMFDDAAKPIDYRFLEINPAFEGQTGIANAVGRRMREIAPTHEEHWFEIYGRVARTGEPMRFQNPAQALRRYYDVNAFRVGKPEQRRVAILFNDITERKRAEAVLIEADRRKTEFLATLAHELRGPLAPLRNMLEIMKRADGNGDLIGQARNTMDRQLGQMARLVDDLLDVSRISQGRVELKRERVELASVVYQAVEACRPLAESAKHEVKVTLPPEPIYLHADPVRLAQILGNLLNNSCKYTEPGGKIWLTAEVRSQESGVRSQQEQDQRAIPPLTPDSCLVTPEVVVQVKDTGIGIPPDKLGGIFEMFTQVDQTLDRSQGGLGIGLTLVRQLVELHGGTVAAFSEGPGRGSEFVVRLPILVEEPQGQGPPPPTGKEQPITAHRILIVDDNRDSAVSLALLLKMTGHETHTAHDGLEAVAAAERFRPDLVLLDIGLPKLNGYDACRRIREQPWGKSMVLVALTGWGQAEDRRRAEEAGFKSHMVKPVDLDALMNLLASLPPERDRQLTKR